MLDFRFLLELVGRWDQISKGRTKKNEKTSSRWRQILLNLLYPSPSPKNLTLWDESLRSSLQRHPAWGSRYTDGKNKRLIAAPTNGSCKGKKSHLTKWDLLSLSDRTKTSGKLVIHLEEERLAHSRLYRIYSYVCVLFAHCSIDSNPECFAFTEWNHALTDERVEAFHSRWAESEVCTYPSPSLQGKALED